MSDQDLRTPDRRSVLKLAGAGIGSITLIGTTSADPDSTGSGELDTDFDPNDPRAVRTFALETKALDEEEHRRLHDELSSEQIAALREAFSVADIRTVKRPANADGRGRLEGAEIESDGATIASHGETTTETYSQTATSTLGFDLWTIHHDISWEYDGSGVYNISSRSRAEEHDFTWGYDGTIDYSFDVSSSSFESWRQDKFSSDIYQLTCSPHSELVGTADGSWYVSDSSLGGC